MLENIVEFFRNLPEKICVKCGEKIEEQILRRSCSRSCRRGASPALEGFQRATGEAEAGARMPELKITFCSFILAPRF